MFDDVNAPLPLVLYWVQVLAENLINAPGLSINFTSPESLVMTAASKAALRAASYKHAAEAPFAGWSTPIVTPTGQLANDLPYDRNGVPRSASDLPGAWV